MIPGLRAEVVEEADGIKGMVRIRIPAGEFYVHPKMLEHVRGLEGLIERLEADRDKLIDELKRRGPESR